MSEQEWIEPVFEVGDRVQKEYYDPDFEVNYFRVGVVRAINRDHYDPYVVRWDDETEDHSIGSYSGYELEPEDKRQPS